MALKTAFTQAHLALSLGFMCTGAFAVDLDLNIGVGHPEPPRTIVVQGPTTVERHWVPDQIVRREEQVVVKHGHFETREERVLVEPPHIAKREEHILVEPARFEKRKETVLVRDAITTRQWVPEVTERVRVGPVSVTRTVHDGYWLEVQPAQYEVVVKEVKVPARYETVVKEVQVPARYDVVAKQVEVGARYETVMRDVLIPGHWQESVVTPPPAAVVVEPARSSGFDLDLDFGRRHRRD